MMHKARRTIATALIFSLLASLAPLDAYAIVLSGKVATPGAGTSAIGLPGSAVTAVAPVSLTVGAPSLSPSLTAIAAPALRPSALALSAPSDAPAAPGASETPASPAPAPAAAAEAAKTEPVAPAPVERKTLLGGLKALLSRGAPKAAVAPDFDKGLDRVFDGSATKSEDASASVFSAEGSAGKWALRRFEKHVAKRARTNDEFGGPKPIGPMTTAQKAGYGLKWGLNMVGIVAAYDLVLRPLFAAVSWPSLLSDGVLEAFGRVALLTKLGPADIEAALSLAPATFLGLPLLATAAVVLAAKPLAKALGKIGVLSRHERLVKFGVYGAAAAFALLAFASAPGSFLGMSLPIMVGLEEISYRVFSFLPAFALMALTRPVMNWLAAALDLVPDHAGVRGTVQKVFRFIGGTFAWYAYPVAAVMASFSFAAAHFGAWGVDPYVFFVQFTLGMVLTRLAYKSESLTPSIVAHLVFNLAMFGGPLLFALGLPGAAQTYGLLAAVGGAVFLLYNYLSYRKDQAQAKKGLFSAGKTLTIAALAAGLAFGAAQMTGGVGPTQAGWSKSAVSALAVQDAERAGLPAATQAEGPAAQTVGSGESRADVIARVAPSVFRVRVANGSGTGFIISPQGLAVSNGHVTGATPVGGFVMVDIEGAPPLRAKLLAVNHDKDIALLQLPRHPSGSWNALKIAQTAPRVGDETIAIGYPLGLEQTVTRGIVSANGRHLNLYVAHIQTDASINPGNSGGPLFNEKGEILGINTMIVTRNGGSVGLGFAIIAPDLARSVAQYAATGDIATGRLGVIINLSDPLKPEGGLLIEHVRPGSGAEKAGLQRGDLIVRIGETRLLAEAEASARDMAGALAQTIPGQKVKVVVLRGEQAVTVDVTIDAKASGNSH